MVAETPRDVAPVDPAQPYAAQGIYGRNCDGCGQRVAARSATMRVLCHTCHPGDLPMSEAEAANWPTDAASGERGAADQTAADLIAAVLAVTPTMVVPSYLMPGGGQLPDRRVVIGGADAEPIAARQAVAVLRAAEAQIAAECAASQHVQMCWHQMAMAWNRYEADAIEAAQ